MSKLNNNEHIKVSGIKNPLLRICVTVVWHTKKEPTAQIAHLVFANTQANAEKAKRAIFFANARIIQTKKVTLKMNKGN